MSCGKVCFCDKRGIDYYGVLSLKKNCNDLEIKAAFRRLAIRYNPERAKDESLWPVFSLVAEAYDVLSDSLRRTVYDQFGEEGLKNGVLAAEGFIQPYVYHGEPMRTYREFFGTENPYADLLHVLTQSSSLLEFPEGRGLKRKEEPLIKTLYLTLLEVFLGGIKKMKIQRLVLVGDDKSRTVTKEKILTIPIKPGIPTGTRIVFPEEGDQGPTKIPDFRKHIPGEGLPVAENPKEKGNLIIMFNVEFPVYLPMSNKTYVKRAFDTSGDIKDTEYVHRFILANKMRRNVDFDVSVRRDPNDREAKQLEFICNG